MADSKKQVRPGGPHGRGHGYQRPQDLRGTVGKLLGYIGRYKGALIVVAVCLIPAPWAPWPAAISSSPP